jgi:hypothetical protein
MNQITQLGCQKGLTCANERIVSLALFYGPRLFLQEIIAVKNIALVSALVLTVAALAGSFMLSAKPAAAQTHDQLCKANYDQCMKACDGATSCSNQCLVNYNGCLGS